MLKEGGCEISHDARTHLKVFLFDLDGTIMLSGGAGMRAMSQAFKERYGLDDAFRDIVPDGKTDPIIFREIIHGRGLQVGDEDTAIRELASIYEKYMRVEMPISPNARLMPGVVEFIEALSKEENAILGLLTGNFENTARIKLDRFGLNHFFRFGAYGSDSAVRSDLVPIAIAHAESVAGRKIGLGPHVFVIGDTPLDVRCALDNRVTSVGVATAGYTAEKLLAAGAHICFENFSDTSGVIAALNSLDCREHGDH